VPKRVNALVHSESASSRNRSNGREKNPKVSVFRKDVERAANLGRSGGSDMVNTKGA
jgi:hypothetical protein